MAMSETADPDEAGPEIVVGQTAAGDPYRLPVEDVLTGRAFVTGKSGSGKSNTGSVVAEELLERGHPLLVVDVDGEYWGLKEAYEVLHVGATEECDLQVGPEHAGKLAELALDQHVPIVLDVSGYVDGDEADALVRETAQELFVREQDALQPFLLLVEEIHEYIPQQGGLDDVGDTLIRVAKRGRKRGLGVMGLSQRPADVKKDFITQADLLVWHRLTWDNDTDVVKRVVDAATADAVEDLDDGEAFVQADWHEADVERVQVRRKETFDAGATPGLDDVDRPELKSIGEDLVDELDAISAEQDRRRDRITELEATIDDKDDRIAELELEIERLKTADETLDLLTRRLDGSASGEGEISDELQDRLEEKNERIRELEDDLDEVGGERDTLQERVDDLQSEVERLQAAEERVEQAERVEEQLERARDVLGVDVQDGATAGAPDADVESLRERIAELEAENERLRDQPDGSAPAGDDLAALLNHEAIQAAIETAKERGEAGEKHHDPVLSVLATADGRSLSTTDIAAPLPISKRTVQRVVKALHSAGVVQTEDSNPTTYKLDREFIEHRIEVAEKQAAIAGRGVDDAE